MVEWHLGEEEKARVDAGLTHAGLPPEGIKRFHSLYQQWASLDAHDWIFRSCFMKDGKVTNDCVIMRFGDGYPKDGLKGSAARGAQRIFGRLTRNAIFDRIVLSTLTMSIGHNQKESSLLKFAKHCPEAISNRIKDEINSLKKIDGFEALRTYRNKRAAHHDLDYCEVQPLYSTVEKCLQRILQAMKVVYPEIDWMVDWKKREDIISRTWNPNRCEWTTDPGEPFIVQFLKELAIRRRWEDYNFLEPFVEKSEFAQSKRKEILAEIEEIRAS